MSHPRTRAARPFGTVRIVGALAALGLAGACVPRSPEPAPSPAAPAAPSTAGPVINTLPTPTYDNWFDAPQTPGDWRYSASGPVTQATFAAAPGPGPATIVCDLGTRRIGIARAGQAARPVQMRIRSESADRLVTAEPHANGLVAEFAADDPILDAIAFSKGRFAIETAGRETLYLPAYPEVSRVIEDCRRGALR